MAKKLKRVKLDDFQKEIQAVLQEYGDYIADVVVKEAVHKTAEDTAEKISAEAKKQLNGKQYFASITAGYPQTTRKKYTETIYAESPHYRLAHLLEKGHAKVNGGRTRAFPHWETGESGAGERLITHIKEGLK